MPVLDENQFAMTLRKFIITPYFGQFPPWMDLFIADFAKTMKPLGYDWILDTDLPDFRRRVKETLGIDYPGVRGTSNVWDYRGSFGELYSEELDGYEYWGIMDFDVVFGRVNKFLPDDRLSELDVWSSHNEYVCGCFSLFKNSPEVNSLFRQCPEWKDKMTDPNPSGWVEMEYSRELERSGLKYDYTFHQGYPWTKEPVLKKEGDKLFQMMEISDWREIMFFHFRHSKKWPL
jgi:hypothetical protein